ncbi:MAG: hypothetical protein VR78_13275 [Hoeflea sp. BRH_c9]|nr:MAG: hypothetical protein VR78_13275 [Hoeflea sp. BRH_c9]
MKAVVVREFGAVGSALIEEVAKPQAGPGQVVLEVAAVAANFVDTLVLQGKYQFLPERPFIPGKLPVGTVRDIGEGVTNLKPGNRVISMAEHGGYAQFVVVAADQCFAVPDSLSFDDAASMSLAFDTAWFALVDRARLLAGETVLVMGATGAVGQAAIQLAKTKGAKVLAGVSSSAKSNLALAAGADGIIDLSAPNLRESVREQVGHLTNGNGADVVLDPLGGDFFDAAIRAVAWRGRYVVIGFASGRIPEIKANYLLLKNIEVSGIQVSDYRKRRPDLIRKCFTDIFSMYEQGMILPQPTSVYALSDYANALEDLLSRRVEGRAILHP